MYERKKHQVAHKWINAYPKREFECVLIGLTGLNTSSSWLVLTDPRTSLPCKLETSLAAVRRKKEGPRRIEAILLRKGVARERREPEFEDGGDIAGSAGTSVSLLVVDPSCSDIFQRMSECALIAGKTMLSRFRSLRSGSTSWKSS